MTTTDNNSSKAVRATLASQLDRLDKIVDTLNEGLNEAIATAVEQAVERAVSGAMTALTQALEIAIKDAMASAVPAPAVPVPAPAVPVPAPAVPVPAPAVSAPVLPAEVVSAPRTLLGRAWAWTTGKVCQLAKAADQHLLLTACSVGVAAGVVTYLAGPWLGMVAAWVIGFGLTLGYQGFLAKHERALGAATS